MDGRKFIDYLEKTYHPQAIVTYGSYACGMYDEYSDFDCLLIVNEKNRNHDDTLVENVPLDCFIFTTEEAKADDVDPFLTIYDGTIIKDTDGIATDLQVRVREYVKSHSVTEPGEKEFITSWARKTLRRMEKGDDEGNFRAVMLLEESIVDYFMLRDQFYFGSKKAGAYLKEHDPEGYRLWREAICGRTNEAIASWAEYVIKQ